MSLGGTITQASNLAESLQVAFDAGAKRILLPMSSVTDIPSVPGELFAKFQTSFYSDPVDAVFKALGCGVSRLGRSCRSALRHRE
jgi:ATP-dependent Lon protease